MDNAHERMGWLTYTDDETSVRVAVERAIYTLEKTASIHAVLHFASIVGGDTAIGALRAAISLGKVLTLTLPEGESVRCITSIETQFFQADLKLVTQKRALRHLIAGSPQLLGQSEQKVLIQPHYDADMAWKMIVYRMAVPGVPEWGRYIMNKMAGGNKIQPLGGINCSPVILHVERTEVLDWLSRGLAAGDLVFPDQNGMVGWDTYGLEDAFRESSDTELSFPIAA